MWFLVPQFCSQWVLVPRCPSLSQSLPGSRPGPFPGTGTPLHPLSWESSSASPWIPCFRDPGTPRPPFPASPVHLTPRPPFPGKPELGTGLCSRSGIDDQPEERERTGEGEREGDRESGIGVTAPSPASPGVGSGPAGKIGSADRGALPASGRTRRVPGRVRAQGPGAQHSPARGSRRARLGRVPDGSLRDPRSGSR